VQIQSLLIFLLHLLTASATSITNDATAAVVDDDAEATEVLKTDSQLAAE